LNFLGNLLQAKGDYNAAEPLYRRALEARERTNGPGRPETLDVLTGDVLTGLIILLDRTNRSQEASDLLRAKAVLSDKARAAVLYRWACSECLLGNLERARELIAEDISLHPNNLSPAIEDDDLQAIRPILESLRASAVQDAENQEIE
jgi:tetratricopeptide (TPR) repeat protein